MFRELQGWTSGVDGDLEKMGFPAVDPLDVSVNASFELGFSKITADTGHFSSRFIHVGTLIFLI
jgi:hypothetical protein